MKSQTGDRLTLSLDEWLRGELITAFGLETEAWAIEQVRRVGERLQARRAPALRFQCEVLWLQQMRAFTAPGRYIYLSRQLLQRLPTDDAVAFVIAHEIAHHDLGHLDAYPGYLPSLRHLPGLLVASALFHLQGYLIGPERESEADAFALVRCLAAGYEGKRCLALFDTLEAEALDHGDLDMAYGPDVALKKPEEPSLFCRAQFWGWQRRRGYLPIRQRKAALVKLMAGSSGPSNGAMPEKLYGSGT